MTGGTVSVCAAAGMVRAVRAAATTVAIDSSGGRQPHGQREQAAEAAGWRAGTEGCLGLCKAGCDGGSPPGMPLPVRGLEIKSLYRPHSAETSVTRGHRRPGAGAMHDLTLESRVRIGPVLSGAVRDVVKRSATLPPDGRPRARREPRRPLSRQGEEALGKIAEELIGNPVVNGAIARAFDAREKAVQAQEAAMGALNLPSAADIERVTRRLRSLSQRLEGIEDAMDRIEERSRGDAAEARLAAIEGRLDEIAADVAALRAAIDRARRRCRGRRSA